MVKYYRTLRLNNTQNKQHSASGVIMVSVVVLNVVAPLERSSIEYSRKLILQNFQNNIFVIWGKCTIYDRSKIDYSQGYKTFFSS